MIQYYKRGDSVKYNEIISQRLRELRSLRNLRQEDLAVIIGKSRECYNQYETGKRKISVEQLCKIADEFDLKLDWFTGRDPETNKKIKYDN